VVKARTWLAVLMLSFGTVAATVSCGSDETPGGGGLITSGSGGAAGAAGSSAVGRGGSVGTAGSAATSTSSLGLTCTTDADCATGMTCLQPNGTDLGTGGPPDGLCTAACMTDDDCTGFEAGAGCVTFTANATSGFCLESCVIGDPTDPTAKCQGRSDFLCVDLAQMGDPSSPFCVPLCQNDAQCGIGAFCNPQSGLCEAAKPTGNPVGTPCDPTATTDKCLGFCFQTSATGVTPATGACTELCSGGTECFFTGTKAGGFCARTPQGYGLFDVGICESGCNCDSDCPFPGDVCQAWQTSDATLKTDIGSAGVCFPNALGSTELTCGSGEAGAGNAPGAAGAAN
jgi:hypothetical protein